MIVRSCLNSAKRVPTTILLEYTSSQLSHPFRLLDSYGFATRPLFRPFRASHATLAAQRPFDSVSHNGTADFDNVEIASTTGVLQDSTVAKPFMLRPYQRDCVDAVLNALKRGEHTRLGVSAPTGSGKTAIFTSLIRKLPPLIHPATAHEANQVLILVGSIVLAQQAAATVSKRYPHLVVELEQGNSKASGRADVTVATYQTLVRPERLEKFDPNFFKAVIVDEAHHAVSASYLTILTKFDPRIEHKENTLFATRDDIKPNPLQSALEAQSTQNFCEEEKAENPITAQIDDSGQICVPLLAFTATWGRADGLGLGKVFDEIVWHGNWIDFIEKEWLSPLRFTTVSLGDALDLKSVKINSKSGDFVLASLVRAVDRTAVNQLAVQAYLERAADKRSTLIFAVNISHVVSLTTEFREQGIDARFVHEKVHPRDREILYQQFRDGVFPVLINCAILTEGADFPSIDCVMLLRPTRSRNLFLQMIGRGLRLSPETGKISCLILDLVGNAAQGIMCTPTLFGVDPSVAIEAQSPAELSVRSEEEEEKRKLELAEKIAAETELNLSETELNYREYSTVFDFVAHQAKNSSNHAQTSVKRLSRLSWVGIGNNVYILDLMMIGYIQIIFDTHLSVYRAKLYRRINATSGIRFLTPTEIASHPDLTILIRTVDRLVLDTPSLDPGVSLLASAHWRRNEITPGQQKFILNRLSKLSDEEKSAGIAPRTTIEGVWVGKGWRDEIEVSSLNRGQASEVIIRLKHGSQAIWKRKKKMLEKEELKFEQTRSRLGS